MVNFEWCWSVPRVGARSSAHPWIRACRGISGAGGGGEGRGTPTTYGHSPGDDRVEWAVGHYRGRPGWKLSTLIDDGREAHENDSFVRMAWFVYIFCPHETIATKR